MNSPIGPLTLNNSNKVNLVSVCGFGVCTRLQKLAEDHPIKSIQFIWDVSQISWSVFRGKKEGSKLLDHLVAWDGINYVQAVFNKIKSLQF